MDKQYAKNTQKPSNLKRRVIQDDVWRELAESSSAARRRLTTYTSAYGTPQSSSPIRNYELLSVTRNNNFFVLMGVRSFITASYRKSEPL